MIIHQHISIYSFIYISVKVFFFSRLHLTIKLPNKSSKKKQQQQQLIQTKNNLTYNSINKY